MSDTGPGSAAHDDQYLILAFYIVIDVSWSMHESGAIDEANQLVPMVLDAITENPVLGDLVRIGVIDFSDDAQVVLPLGDLRNVKNIPQLVARGGTSYAAAFRHLRKDIERDYAQLKSDNYRVHRPGVFFITDGAPTDAPDDLNNAFAELTAKDFKARPNIIPFGVGEATKEVLDPWIFPRDKKMRSYIHKETDPKVAMGDVAHILIATVLSSASSVDESGQAGGLVLPDADESDEWI